MTDRQKLTGELNRNIGKIGTLKKRNRLIRGKLFLIDQAIRPKVPAKKQEKIDRLIQEMLDHGISDWSTFATKINTHRFRVAGKLWMGPVIKRYWEEREI